MLLTNRFRELKLIKSYT